MVVRALLTVQRGFRLGHPSISSRILVPVTNAPSTRAFHATLSPFITQKLEVVSLPDDGSPGRVQSVIKKGTVVQVGQVVVVLDVKNGRQLEIVSPNYGTIIDCHVAANDLVSIGDELVSIDVDKTAAASSKVSQLEESFLKFHEQGDVPNHFWEQVSQHDNIPDLMQLAILLQRFPSMRVKNLIILERILDLQKIQGASEETIAESYTDLGTHLYRLGDLDAALIQFQQALQLFQGALSDNDLKLASCHVRMAAVLQRKGDLQGSFDAFQKALEIQKAAHGAEHAAVAVSLNNLGALKYMMGDWKTAIGYYQESLDIHIKIHGQDHVDTAGSYHNMATAVKHSGDLHKALELERTALKIRSTLGKDHPDTAASHYSLAHLLSELGELDGALEQYNAALDIQESVYGKLHSITASTYNNMGAVLYQKGDFDNALKRYRQGLDILQNSLPDATPDSSNMQQFLDVAMSLNNVGLALHQLGKFDEALSHHEQAKVILTQLFGPDDPSLATTIASIANTKKRQGKVIEALVDYRIAHDMLIKDTGTIHHPDVASSHNNIGLILGQMGQLDAALVEYRAALSIFSTIAPNHPHTASCHYNIALVLTEQGGGNQEQARQEFEKARDIWMASLGPNHPQTSMAIEAIANIKNQK